MQCHHRYLRRHLRHSVDITRKRDLFEEAFKRRNIVELNILVNAVIKDDRFSIHNVRFFSAFSAQRFDIARVIKQFLDDSEDMRT